MTAADFEPSGVVCASGYTGSVDYTACGSAGTNYYVTGCEAVAVHSIDVCNKICYICIGSFSMQMTTCVFVCCTSSIDLAAARMFDNIVW